MKKKERDEMPTKTSKVNISKRERIIKEGSEKYANGKHLESLASVNGKMRINENIDIMKMIRELRGKE